MVLDGIGKGKSAVNHYSILCTVYHAPLGRFSMVDISTAVRMVLVPKRSVLETPIREHSEVSLGVGTLFGVEQSRLENLPRGV